MTPVSSVEELLYEVMDRLARQESRLAELEARVRERWPGPAPVDTPAEIRWPSRPAGSDRLVRRPPEILEDRLREAEVRLREAARLETLGRLVAGIAHDFTNLLTVITGCAEVVQAALTPDNPAREPVETIAATARTAAAVAQQLVGLARPSRPQPGPLDVNVALRDLERTLRGVTGERVRLEFLPAPALPLVCVDPGQFDQVVLNLVVNARDAIGGGGRITIRTAVVCAGPDRPGWPADLPSGEFVALTVTDTGRGMTPDVLARIFDPFFTTKGERGTGLGLAVVRDVVRSAGGHVEVESQPGWGTSVRVYWPVLATEAES